MAIVQFNVRSLCAVSYKNFPPPATVMDCFACLTPAVFKLGSSILKGALDGSSAEKIFLPSRAQALE